MRSRLGLTRVLCWRYDAYRFLFLLARQKSVDGSVTAANEGDAGHARLLLASESAGRGTGGREDKLCFTLSEGSGGHSGSGARFGRLLVGGSLPKPLKRGGVCKCFRGRWAAGEELRDYMFRVSTCASRHCTSSCSGSRRESGKNAVLSNMPGDFLRPS